MCPTSADPRAVRTRYRLRGALLDLLRTRDWDDVTVADVVTHARCSRSTFYAHYEDLDALLADAFLGAAQIVPATGQGHCLDFVPGLFEHLAQHRVLAEPYLLAGRGGPMVAAFRERINTHIRERLDATAPTLTEPQRGEMTAALGGAVWAALIWWLEHGQDITPTDAATTILTLLDPGLSRVTHN